MKHINNYILERLHISKDNDDIISHNIDIKEPEKLQFDDEELAEFEAEAEQAFNKENPNVKYVFQVSRTGGLILIFKEDNLKFYITKPKYYNDKCYRIRLDDGSHNSHPYQYPPTTGKYTNAKGNILLPTPKDVIYHIIKYGNKHYDLFI